MPHSGHIKTLKPAMAAKQSVIRMSSLTSESSKKTSYKIMLLSPRKRRKKIDKSARVRVLNQIQRL